MPKYLDDRRATVFFLNNILGKVQTTIAERSLFQVSFQFTNTLSKMECAQNLKVRNVWRRLIFFPQLALGSSLLCIQIEVFVMIFLLKKRRGKFYFQLV